MVGYKVYTHGSSGGANSAYAALLTVVTAPTILLYESLYAFFVGIAFHGYCVKYSTTSNQPSKKKWQLISIN